MKKKNRSKALGILTVSLIIIIIGIISLSGIMFSVSEDLPRARYIEAPVFGYLSCSPTQPKTVSQLMDGEFGQDQMSNPETATPYTCKDFLSLTEECTITVTVIDGDLTTFADTTAQLDYQRVSSGTSFQTNSATTLPNGLSGYDNMEKVTLQLEKDDVLWVRYTEGKGLVGQDKYDGKVRFTVTGTPYTLYDHNTFSDRNGQVLSGARTGNCYLENDAYKDRKIQYADSGIQELEGRGGELDWRALNKINGRYTYMAGFTTVPYFDAKIETYNGKTAYCMNNKMYETLEIRVDGYTYEIVNYDAGGFIEQVTCCNGDETPDRICVDHTWKSKESYECDASAGRFCPQSTYQEFGSKQYKRYECVSNECVADIIDVECNSEADCGNGETCAKFTDPQDNTCVELGSGGQPTCGDGKCETYERDTCPLDCAQSGIGLDLFYVWLIGGVLVAIIIMLIVKLRMSK